MNLAPARFYLRFYRGSAGKLGLGILVACLQPLIILPMPLVVRHVFDHVIGSGRISSLLAFGVLAVGLEFAYACLGLWVSHLILTSTKAAILELRAAILGRFYSFSRAFHTRHDRPDLHTKIVQDTERLDIMSNALAGRGLPAMLAIAVLAGVLAYLSPLLFAVTVAAVPLLYALDRFVKGRLRQRIQRFHRSFEAFSQGVLSVLQRMDLTRLQSAEAIEMERQRATMDDLRITSGRMAWLGAAYDLTQNSVVALGGIVIVILGGASVAAGRMTVGGLLAFYLAFTLARTHIRKIVNIIPQLVEGGESLRTLYDLMTVEDTAPYAGSARVAFSGHVALEGVRFGYNGGPVLDGVTLEILPRSRVAVIGANGSGKSTILWLLLGFYRPQQGVLRADGRPYDELDIGHLRRFIGVVPQDPILFPGTVLENITYGSPEAPFEQVVRAATLATAHEAIEALPQGYRTVVGERGVLLSGGQRQRIAIARALLRSPPLLILDEPTNHLDRDSVASLLENLSGLRDAPATLMVSHDPRIVALAGTVYALRDGRLFEEPGGGVAGVE